MSWGAQNRSKDEKTPTFALAMSRKSKPALCGIQPYLWLTGSAAGVPVYCWGWRLLLWVGVHRPAAAAASSQSFYDFYKKLTELSANKLALLFCWLWSSVASPNSAVYLLVW
jgi:hypothetical protein